jgi:hypothetical protein
MLFESREKYQAKEVEFASNINSAEDRIRQFLQMANVRTEADLPKACQRRDPKNTTYDPPSER